MNEYIEIPQNKNNKRYYNSIPLLKKVKIKIQYQFEKSGFFLIFLLLLIITKNIDLNFLENDLFFSKKKRYHYYAKYLKAKSIYVGYLKKISLINEIFFLYNIRKEINNYKHFNYSNINYRKFNRVLKPKISLIITVYNQENYILRMYLCILNQSFTDIEIIFFDDNSNDTSSKIIKNLMKYDKRIVYLKNKCNKGQFYSRNKATLFARSKYILIIDPDDFLLNNILHKCYKIAKKFDLDITQFYHVMGNYSVNHLVVVNQHSKIIYQQDAKNVFFNNPTRYLWDKLIKKSIFIKSIYFMHENYRKERFLIHNDDTACFGLFKIANSFAQIEDVGYFYNTNISNSTTKKNFLYEKKNDIKEKKGT